VSRAVLLGCLVTVAGCAGYPVVEPASLETGRTTSLTWFMVWTCGAVSVSLLAALAVALRRPARSPSAAGDRRRALGVLLSVVASSVLLLVLLVASVLAGRPSAAAATAAPLDIEVVGHQWWWQVHYPNARSDLGVTTANEIHVPVGRPVRLDLSSQDVIHSFWVPNLAGKRDLIPGRRTTLRFVASKPGRYVGQCAEFCGYQHAHMGLLVIAEPERHFVAWLARQQLPAAITGDPSAARGRKIFLSSQCVLCHTVRGERAFGATAPDLTHVGSRQRIAANTLPNTRGHLAGWIVDSQRIKPGSQMPPNLLPPQDLLDLVSYLETLR
jgi:cytochrome c oxidase subunit 2